MHNCKLYVEKSAITYCEDCGKKLNMRLLPMVKHAQNATVLIHTSYREMSLTLRKLRDVKISNQILKNLITINKGGRNYVISN